MTPDDVMPVTRPPKTRRRRLLNAGLVAVLLAAFLYMLLPQVCRVRDAAARAHDSNNLKQLALAEHNYADVFDGILGPYAQVSPGVMNTELSFRVSLMPYIESTDLQSRIDWTQPWEDRKSVV